MRNSRFFQLRRARLALSLALSFALLLGAIGGQVSRAADGPRGLVTGSVRNAAGVGIGQATIQIDALVVHTDPYGTIPPTAVPLNGRTELVEVLVSAPGYAPWRFVDVELSVARPVELRVVLSDRATTIAPGEGGGAEMLPDAGPQDGPPDFIRVARTFSSSCVYPPTNVQRVDRVPFMDYVRGVLPNEWIASWQPAALDAGAVAIAQYAWSAGFAQRKWTRYGYPFDVLDSTCDQVYKDRDPARNYAATDAAVSRMWGAALLRNGALFTTFYRARDEQCGSNLDCMGQYGSQDLALQGWSGLQILQHYYSRRAPFFAAATAPTRRPLLLRRSPDVVVWPGRTQTLTVCLRNAGTEPWQEGVTSLGIVDPADPTNHSYVSPFADPSWPSPQRPATLQQPSVALGENGVWSFSITAPAGLAPGRYQLAVQPVQDNTATWLATDTPLIWNVTVTPPTTLSAQGWLPLSAAPTGPMLCP